LGTTPAADVAVGVVLLLVDAKLFAGALSLASEQKRRPHMVARLLTSCAAFLQTGSML
jgi:hypothetical protein